MRLGEKSNETTIENDTMIVRWFTHAHLHKSTPTLLPQRSRRRRGIPDADRLISAASDHHYAPIFQLSYAHAGHSASVAVLDDDNDFVTAAKAHQRQTN